MNNHISNKYDIAYSIIILLRRRHFNVASDFAREIVTRIHEIYEITQIENKRMKENEYRY